MSGIIDRVRNILLQPASEWEVIAGETTTTAELYRNYIVILAAIGPVAYIIGMSIVGASIPLAGTHRIPLGSAIVSAAAQYILNLAAVYVLALIIDYLAPTFSGQKDMNQALKLTAYSMTASWLAAVFIMIPALSVLTITGLYSLYLLYAGIPVCMKAPREKALPYTVVIVIAAFVIFAVFGVVTRGFMQSPMAGYRMPM